MEHVAYTIENARDGKPTLRVRAGDRDVLIHSAYHPLADARVLEESFNPDRYDILVVLGAGLGYHLAPLREIAGRYRRVVVIDALPGLEAEIARVPESAFLAAGGTITLLAGLALSAAEEALTPLLDMEDARGIQVLEHPQSLRALPDYYREIRSVIERILNRGAGDLATRSALGLRFFKNAAANLARLGMHRPARTLAGRFAGLPALAVTSGPTLAKHLAELCEHQKRLFIIAVDSALPVLLRAGVAPDFCVSIDPQPYIVEHFMRAPESAALPLVSVTSEPRVFARAPGFVSLNTHPVSQFLEEAFPGAVGSFHSATGTVAGDAVRTALLMGFGAVGLAGFDFSFPSLEIYARGTAYQDRYAAIFQERFSPVETRNLRYVMQSSGGVRAGALYSRKSFLRYRESLEDLVLSKAECPIQAIAPAGVPLRGAPALSLEEFIARHAGPVIDKRTVVRGVQDGTAPLEDAFTLRDIARLADDGVTARLAAASLGEGHPGIARAAAFLRGVLRGRR